MKKIIYLFFLLCLLPIAMFGQTYQIEGRVTDASDGSPMPGVTVKTGQREGTMTDADGHYSIKALKGDALTFTFVGMTTQTVKVESGKHIDVAMQEDTQKLDEVVVIGYGTVKKRDLSGSVGQVRAGDILDQNPLPSISQALQGRMAGVVVRQNDGSPGAGMSITVRGTNSFSTSSQPLYVVDGIPYDVAAAPAGSLQADNNQTSNALANINPNDIESIEVLKDASATAIYGSRGANGVVLITTKRGEQGKDKIEFMSNFGVSRIGKKIKMLDPVTYARYVNEETMNSFKYDGTAYGDLPYPGKWSYTRDANNNIMTNTGVYKPSPEDFLSPGLRTDKYGNKTMVGSTDWQDAILQTGYSQEYNLNISGGSDKGWYNISGNYLNQTGIIKNSGYKRYAVRANTSRKLRSWLEVGLNINYTNSTTDFVKTNSPSSALIRSALIFPPTYDISVGMNESTELNWLSANPYNYVRDAKDQLITNNTFNASYAQITLTDYLKFRQNLGLNYSNNNRYNFYSRYTQEGYNAGGLGGAIGQSDNWYQSTTAESILTFDKTFNKVHSLNAVGGFTYEQSNYGGKSISGKNLTSEITESYDLSRMLNPNLPISSSKVQSSLVSLLGRVNYSYTGRYIATASFRRDGSSKFAPGNKFANFASGALAWRASEESFVKNLNVFDNLKLRVSYGQTGNQGLNPYQTQFYLGTANYPFNGSLNGGFAEIDWRGLTNDKLKWETTDQYNAGLDISILKGKVNFVVDYYYKKTSNLLQNLKVPSSTGFANMWSNSAFITNNGLEISGKFYPVTQKDFAWDIDANIAFNKNKIGGLDGDQYATRLWYAADNVFIQRNGLPVGAIYGYVENGFYNNLAEVRADPQYANVSDAIARSMVGEVKYRDINGNGKIDDNDRTVIGDTNPKYTFGITNNFRWKSFTMNMFWQGVYGNDIFNANLMDVTMTNIANIPQSAYDTRWTEDNKANARWSKPLSGGYNRVWKLSDRYIEDGSYLRLRNLNVGYSFKPHFKGINSVNVYASATNLLTFTKYSWYDPDVNTFAGDASRRGVDLYSYPSSKTYSLGFKLDF